MRKEVYSVPAIATYVGTIFTIWMAVTSNIEVALVTSFIVIAVLSGYLISINNKYRNAKPYKNLDAELHRLCNRTSGYLTSLRCADTMDDVNHFTEAALKNALTIASRAFSRITKRSCSSSLMLKTNGDLNTNLYCHESDPERESNPSAKLDAADGIAGEAMSTRTAVSWSSGDSRFKPIRANYSRFYQSGLCVPIEVGFEPRALLNIDSLSANVFDTQEHRELSAMFADTIGIILEANCMWKELNEERTS